MYALNFTSCRFARKLSKFQVCTVSKFTYREMSKDCARVTTTTLLQKTVEEKPENRRNFSLDSIWSVGRKQVDLHMQNILLQSKGILKTVKMSDLSAAPLPAFWYGVGSLVPFVFPTVACLFFGYSPFLATAQLFYGATVCSFLGGMKWGQATVEKGSQPPTWENMGYSVVPQVMAWTALLLPQTLGFLCLITGFLAAAYIDLTSPYYPPWLKASRLVLTLPAVLFLFLTCLLGIFH